MQRLLNARFDAFVKFDEVKYETPKFTSYKNVYCV